MPCTSRILPACLVISLGIVWSGSSVASAQVIVNRASTVGESYARGMADVVRSQREFNLMNSQANINAEEARRRQLENDLRQTEIFFQRRAINRQERFGDYPERAARNAERAARDSERAMIRYGQAGRPRRLTYSELNPLTGIITWPLFLQGPEYAQPRQTINAIMHTRALQEGALSLEEFQAVTSALAEMSSILGSRIREKNSTDFINTRNFLNRLDYEIRNPVS
ncbi:MAG: hypothetical protein K8T91_26660 [Planctomycetes bacterium]|nr:hypothetical protein [Planctomycetota bacterium]